MFVQFFFEIVPQVQTRVHLASEFDYMPFFPDDQALYIFISQSGETADTLEALRLVNGQGLPTIALTNVASSSIVREAGGFVTDFRGRSEPVLSKQVLAANDGLHSKLHKLLVGALK